MMASSALNNIFATYFLSALLGDGDNDGHDGCAGHGRRAWLRDSPQLTPSAFFAAQAAYALWNASNDPLMGWLSDRCSLCARRSSARTPSRAPSSDGASREQPPSPSRQRWCRDRGKSLNL